MQALELGRQDVLDAVLVIPGQTDAPILLCGVSLQQSSPCALLWMTVPRLWRAHLPLLMAAVAYAVILSVAEARCFVINVKNLQFWEVYCQASISIVGGRSCKVAPLTFKGRDSHP